LAPIILMSRFNSIIWRDFIKNKVVIVTPNRFGPDHPDVADSLNSLAELYHKQGRYSEADRLYKRSLQINQKVFGPDHLSVALLLNNLALLYNEQGRYKAVKQSKLDDYRIVYFATHALVAGDLQAFAKAKAEPALVFTVPEKTSELDDGLLEASEAAELKLNAGWVVLSACNTASSEEVSAEPLSGLARAFIYAGGKSLVVSNWDVSDDATAKLMSDLFQISENRPNLSHGEMMRQATLDLIDAATTDEDALPRVWAPFVVVGEPAMRVHS
jgi:hypothetical protein